MSSDGYFEDDLDESAFEQLDAIEAAHFNSISPSGRGAIVNESASPPTRAPSSEYDDSFSLDANELDSLDKFIEDAYKGKQQPSAPLAQKSSSKETLQTTLFGDIIPAKTFNSKPRSSVRMDPSSSSLLSRQQSRKTKQWDHTAFAKSGLKTGKGKGKGKGRSGYEDKGEELEEDVEFEQFPAPFVSIGPPPPMKIRPDLLEAKHWIYPLNHPKRDYQFNIVKHCLFDNTIVALPTGLGKTFIAGVVMLNFYRWFPEGKVVFVAPTKPLVAQQIEACHRTCGIPGSDAVELTGQNPKPMRSRAWVQKRVFYMTPQTFINDLTTSTCDALDIILIVVDEAHRATGNYAYNQVVRFMMSKNPHFRLLALTATPGSTPQAVQELVDSLHISRIEIRNEHSLDIREYLHEKRVEQHIITMSPQINKIKDLFVNLMDETQKPLKYMSNWHPGDLTRLHPFYCLARMLELRKQQPVNWSYHGALMRLSSLARTLGYLMEGTIGMCYTAVQELNREAANEGKKKAASKAKPLRADPLFQAIMNELHAQSVQGFSIHPKMEKMKTLIIQHFGARMGESESDSATRAMVFVTNREAVDEIVEALNQERPLLRASKFVGQGADKQGKKGLGQREQLEIIEKFKANEFNVLVATSVGEEGLDIGEVDLIICYDAQKTPIRMLQRLGRTGRKRSGVVHVLLAEGREEQNLDKAKATYKDVQRTIVNGDQLELYGDAERLVPDNIQPQCLEKEMEIQEYVREEPRKKRSFATDGETSKKGIKRKRNDDIARNVPEGASVGFVSVKDLIVKGSKKRKMLRTPKNFDEMGEDDEYDLDIEAGILHRGSVRRSASPVASSYAVPKVQGKLRKSATTDSRRKQKKRKEQSVTELTSSQFAAKGEDDSDDIDIGNGLFPVTSSTPAAVKHPTVTSGEIIDLSDSGDGHPLSDFEQPFVSPNLSPAKSPRKQSNMAWLIEDDEDASLEIVDSSPSVKIRRSVDDSIEFVYEKSLSPPPPSQIQGASRTRTPYDVDDSIEIVKAPAPSNFRPSRSTLAAADNSDNDIFMVDTSASHDPAALFSSPAANRPSGSQARATRVNLSPTISESNVPPEPSFAIRPIGQKQSKVSVPEELGSPEASTSARSGRRLHRRGEPPARPEHHRAMGNRRPIISAQDKWIYGLEAAHSGDEMSEGSSHNEDDVESESDRVFLEELPETQVSPSYDQSQIYRQSLLTQAPAGPVFAHRPVRQTRFGMGRMLNNQRRPEISSSPPRDKGSDDYILGSFVVDDDAEIFDDR